MKRVAIGGKNALYPSLTTIVGAEVDGKPNWITIAHVGIMNHSYGEVPQYLSIGLHSSHYTNKGIHEYGEFSINIPSQAMLQITDYAGLVTGEKVDKSELFPLESGSLNHAPLIANCPVSMELKLSQTVNIGQHEIFIGEVVNTYIDEACLTDGKPDLAKIDPLLFDFMMIDYWSIGKRTGKPWRDGKSLKK
ncbi:flavin reductase family protein [Desulfosediminicola flagellatus]|uniref:flavin reductase family protein n=1 Tax=Desulfosediminicola flagellatus TaxID=2569541 RepID=UPI0010ACF0DD|nr:flavin reductase family protein [Desulfosediminicola flagellatus]